MYVLDHTQTSILNQTWMKHLTSITKIDYRFLESCLYPSVPSYRLTTFDCIYVFAGPHTKIYKILLTDCYPLNVHMYVPDHTQTSILNQTWMKHLTSIT
jgi:hypothetical protein